MRIIIFDGSDDVCLYTKDCGLIPQRPYFTYQTIDEAIVYLKEIRKIENPKFDVKGKGVLQVCKSCGSPNIGMTKLVNPNTSEILNVEIAGVMWCFDSCKGEAILVNYVDYVSKNS